jgi:hypothetical protein
MNFTNPITIIRTMPISYNLVSNTPDTFAYFELQAFVSTFKVYFVLFKCQYS